MERRKFVQVALGSAVLSSAVPAEAAHATPAVSLLLDALAGSPGEIACEKVRLALKERRMPYEEIKALEAARGDTVLVAGFAKDSAIMARLGGQFHLDLPVNREELLIQNESWNGKKILFVCGSDCMMSRIASRGRRRV